ncbi:hypothetical protein ACFFQW_40235 [Umezawaea endophytica]|uniref:Uncharacterized protein n=1 Tax=Umezawaea endophytica TaxID=1654476 RepID=A0A9X2VYS4_9PSEU|nr:hypothetical protein [Umezawaea endophytica]MCS7484494.1 hypothetical protein [Umezawaea endophytica]
MPIRTNRGRAAVYRRLWSWPLRSPNHLIATIVGFAVVIIVFTSVIPAITKGARGGGSTGAATTTSQVPGQVGVLPSGVPTISLPTKAAPPSSTPASAPVDPDAAVTADLWAEAWITRPADNKNSTWLETLRKYTTEELLPQMATVDPGNLPTALEGRVQEKESHTDSVVFEVGLKGGGTLQMTVVKRAEVWLVHKYDRV